MKSPWRELVLDELIGGAGVRHPQQRLRQHHQREPLPGRQRELAQHVLDAAERIVIGPDRLDQPRRRAIDALLLRRILPRGSEQAGGHCTVVGRIGRAEGRRGMADARACDSLGCGQLTGAGMAGTGRNSLRLPKGKARSSAQGCTDWRTDNTADEFSAGATHGSQACRLAARERRANRQARRRLGTRRGS